MRGRALIAIAGITPAALAQPTLNITADVTSVVFGGTVTWTVSLTGLTGFAHFVQAYDFNLEASCRIGDASDFQSGLSQLIGPTAGTPSGSSILGVSGGQSSLIDPLNLTLGDVVLGTFTVTVDAEGQLSYDVSDGGVLDAEILRVRDGSDFGPIPFQGRPTVRSDSVGILIGDHCVPAPSTAAIIMLAGGITPSRKRS